MRAISINSYNWDWSELEGKRPKPTPSPHMRLWFIYLFIYIFIHLFVYSSQEKKYFRVSSLFWYFMIIEKLAPELFKAFARFEC